jgi:RNA polymerase sigma-70 factor, ECF subfamily
VVTQSSDEQLALGVQQGNKDDLTVLVERHYSRLLGYLYRLCGGNEPMAEDMTQETFLRVMRGISLYQFPRPFKPWLYSIATNIARNHYSRAETRYADEMDEDGAESFADAALLPEERTLLNDEARNVLKALAELPPHQREVVVLFYYQELSQHDIAESLHIPLGTVKSRLSLGLRRLRDIVNREA